MDRWKQIEQLYHAALERPERERAAFLMAACAGDDSLKREVESLLARGDGTQDFLEGPVLEMAARVLAGQSGPSLVGRQMGSYHILDPLGAGGMGEVYRAKDAKLRREVAIKVLPKAFADDPERLSRFRREARTLASLNHPNIAAIYGLEESEGVHYLVLELVPGNTLAEQIARRSLSVDEALRISRQVAEALEAAHQKGITHRDIKPANIKVTQEGKVKVLDFGLAKAFAEDAAGLDLSELPTASGLRTQEGQILGTPPYMSPEQVRGKTVDKQSDIWAFGCVLYELLTGQQAFRGETLSDTIAAVLEREPDWQRLPAPTPASVRTLLRRCLQKDPSRRLRDVGDARIEMEDISTAVPALDPATKALSGAAPVAPVTAKRRSWQNFVGGAAAAFLLSALVWSIASLLQTPEPALPLQATLLPPEDHGFLPDFAISPDGTKIAFSAIDSSTRKSMLWVRQLASTTAQPLAGTDGAEVPFWSPDSRSIAFFADQNRNLNRNLKKIDADGGPVITLAPIGLVFPQGGSWSKDGTIVFTRGTIGEGLYQVSSEGGPVTSLTRYDPGEVNHKWPFFLPDGRHLLFQATTRTSEGNVYEIRLLDLVTKNQTVLTRADNSAAQYANGYLFYLQQGNLMAAPFALSSFTITGAPVAVAQQTRSFGVNSSGLLAFQGRGADASSLIWYSRDGKEMGRVGNPSQYNAVSLSPDASKVAASILDTQTGKRDIWVFELARGTAARVTTMGAGANYPVWSRDGSRVIYWDGAPEGGIYSKLSSGLGSAELVKRETAMVAPNSISPDGRFLAYVTAAGSALMRLWIHQLAPEKPDTKDYPLLGTNFQEGGAQFSPDGRWLAYVSWDSGTPEIYVVPFPSLSSKVQISTSGGNHPRWRRDGREMFYLTPDANMTAVPIDISANSLRPDTPRALFQTRIAGVVGTADDRYDVTADGQRFLINSLPPEQASEPITLYINWAAALQK